MPENDQKTVEALTEDESILDCWQQEGLNGGIVIKVLIPAENTEKILDRLEEKYIDREGFRVVLLAVEGTIPRINEHKDMNAANSLGKGMNDEHENNHPDRVSREELYSSIADSVKFSRNYLILVMISAVVATVGLIQNSVAVIIGAMVIAPLLGPNVGLALATTLADVDLGKAALKTSLVGLGVGLGISILGGLVLKIDPTVHEIAARTTVLPSDIVIALASGSAGVLAFTSGVATALIGVMVSVALLPPLVVFGLLLGAGQMQAAFGAFLLLVTNIICVNLAGVWTLILKGIRPRNWWEANKAGKASLWAITLWSSLLVILVFVVYLSQR